MATKKDTVSEHGNVGEIMGKIMNLGRRIEMTCRKAESREVKLHTFKSQVSCLNDYVECLEELTRNEKKS